MPHVACAGNLPAIRIDAVAGMIEGRCVEHVEGIRAELQILALERVEVLKERHIDAFVSRPDDLVPGRPSLLG